ncbi:MAG: S8 family serine peptidase [Candidatus Margulisiibacteriota bacterium]
MTRIKHIGWLILPFILCLSGFSAASIAPNKLYVKFKANTVKLPKGLSASSIQNIRFYSPSIKSLAERYAVQKFEQVYAEALKVRPDWKFLEDTYTLKFPQAQDIHQIMQDFKNDPNVLLASTPGTVKAFSVTPNDPGFANQWGLTKIYAPQAWDKTMGSNTYEIAVLDTGIYYNHEDFSGRLDMVKAYDFVNKDTDPLDGFGHGTAVSGVIGATTNNGKGVAGVDWSAKILPIKVLDDSGSGDTIDVSAALAYCAALKAAGLNIVAINMSLGQYNSMEAGHEGDRYYEDDPTELKENCQLAYDQGIVLVAAAGNGNVDWNTYPAYYSTVIAVAATDQSDVRSVWGSTDSITGRTQASNYGTWVDVSAPGTNIYSTNNDGSYRYWNGTSLASPYVAGLVGLIKTDKPSLTAAEIVTRIKTYTDNVDSLQEAAYQGKIGSGRVNAQNTLTALSASITSPTSGAYKNSSFGIYGTASGRNFLNYTLKAIDASSNVISVATGNSEITSGLLGSWNTAGLDGAYTLKLTCFSADSTSKETTVSIIVDNTPPTLTLTAPASGANIRGQLSVTGTVSDLNFDKYELKYEKQASPTYVTIGTFYTPKNGTLGTWETIGLNGNYTFRSIAYDLAGNSTMIDLPVTLANIDEPNKSVNSLAALPQAFLLPNPFDRKTSTEAVFYYSLHGNFLSTIYLFDLSGNMIWQKSYQPGENGGKDGINTPSWDGKSLFGGTVSTGIYLYQIIADQKVLARGKIIVLN